MPAGAGAVVGNLVWAKPERNAGGMVATMVTDRLFFASISAAKVKRKYATNSETVAPYFFLKHRVR